MTGVRKAATAVLAAISVLSLVLAACAGMLGSGGETAERIRELEAQVERLQSGPGSTCIETPRPASPVPSADAPTCWWPTTRPAPRSTAWLIDPAPGSAVPASFHVRGYARNLFEANLVARVMDGAGLVVLEQPTTAAACCFDWGSFDLALEVPLPAGDDFTLELGDYDMADGQWKARQRMTLRVAP